MATKSKNKSFGHYVMVIITFILTLLLLLGYISVYIPPATLGRLAGYSLFIPVLILLNFVVLLYWLFKMKRYFWLTFVVLAIGYSYVKRTYKIYSKKVIKSEDVKLMSYNVRMFNKYEWSKQDSVPQKIADFVAQKSPEILCLQEFTLDKRAFMDYRYKFEKLSNGTKTGMGQAIYSKFPIVNKGSFDFKDSANNVLFADIAMDTDTVRVYNLHLQSIRLNLKKQYFGEKDAEHLSMKIGKVFQLQQGQVEQVLEHQSGSPYPVIIMGDFNNTAFSWVYRKLLKGKRDAFVSAGGGFSPTYQYTLPLRIDFIMVDKKFKINHFRTYDVPFSDHYPSMARIAKK